MRDEFTAAAERCALRAADIVCDLSERDLRPAECIVTLGLALAKTCFLVNNFDRSEIFERVVKLSRDYLDELIATEEGASDDLLS